MRLSELLNGKAGAPDAALSGQDIDILGLSADSRDVRKGDLFAALNGLKARGSDFIAEAAQRGAVAVLGPPGAALPAEAKSLSLVTDPNPRRRLALIAARFFPEQPETIVAVTGTNGKSSVASFTRQIWANTGRRAASMGSLGVEADGIAFELPHTTPEPIALHRTLSDLAQRGIDHLEEALATYEELRDERRAARVHGRLARVFSGIPLEHVDIPRAKKHFDAALAVIERDPDSPALGALLIVRAGAQMLMLNPMFDQMEHLEALPDIVDQASKSL